jgi:hypothetical protein
MKVSPTDHFPVFWELPLSLPGYLSFNVPGKYADQPAQFEMGYTLHAPGCAVKAWGKIVKRGDSLMIQLRPPESIIAT